MSPSARSIVLIAALLPAAGATTITILPAANMAQATADINSWLVLNFGPGTTAKPIQPQIEDVTPGKSNGVVKLQLLTSLHSLYFLMSGFEDNIQIRTADGTKAQVHEGDDRLYFVGITSSTAIGFIQWQGHDRFVLKDFGTSQGPPAAPEPATWLAVATGLIAIKRRYRAPSAPWRAARWISQWVTRARRLRGARCRRNPDRL